MRKNTFNIPQEEMDRFHKAMDAERTEQDARLEKLIESGIGDYAVMTEAYCYGTNGVELWDERKRIDIC